MTELGQAFREWRASRGILLIEVATLLGLKPSELSGYETGRLPWEDGLRVRVEKLLGRTG